MSQPPDLEQLALAARANAADLNALLRAVLPITRRMCYRWCLDVAITDDLTQEVLIRLIRALPGYQPGNFNAWLARMALNAVRDQWRINQRNNTSHTLLEDADTVTAAGDPEQALTMKDAINQLNALPPPQREALWLVAGLGFTEDEAGALLDCPPGTIAWRIHEARRKLRRQEGAE